jgi:hypothetical protein
MLLESQFDSWLDRATASGVAPLRRFATGLRGDYEAVKAGKYLRAHISVRGELA